MDFPDNSADKESDCNAGDLSDTGSIPGCERSPGGGLGNPLQYSCLENPHEQRNLEGYGPWDHKESDTTEQLSKRLSTDLRKSIPPSGYALSGDVPSKRHRKEMGSPGMGWKHVPRTGE